MPLKIGLWTLIPGVASVVVGASLGMGPCGPSTLPGALMFFLGFLAVLFGIPTTIIGLIANVA